MKVQVPPLQLNPSSADRLQLPVPLNPGILFRYPFLMPPGNSDSSSLLDFRAHLPVHLGGDPRTWARDDVASFLRWFQNEFDLPSIDTEKFCMNGKALCLLTKADLTERAPGAGDILHNALQVLLRSRVPVSPLFGQIPPSPSTPLSAPLTPTQRWHHPDLQSLFGVSNVPVSNSVTLSPAPSLDSQSSGSPKYHVENGAINNNVQNKGATSGAAVPHSPHHSTSAPNPHVSLHYHGQPNGNISESEDSSRDSSPPPGQSPVNLQSFTQGQLSPRHNSSPSPTGAYGGSETCVSHNGSQSSLREESSSGQSQDAVDTGTNGRLLWDFLQQLLNDPGQRYTNFIAWKNRETGVFKIMDPAGLAKLWGIQKNHLSMNYDKMSRALRYYYRVNILKKVQGERHCYQFLRNPCELKNIRNLSLLRQSMYSVKGLADNEEGPTDLSMSSVEKDSGISIKKEVVS